MEVSLVRVGGKGDKIDGLLTRFGPVEPKSSIVVGYTANYALFVHENLEMKLYGQPRNTATTKSVKNKKTGKVTKKNLSPKEVMSRGVFWGGSEGMGQSKFLEQPTRELINTGKASRMIQIALEHKAGLMQALYLVGLAIQRRSQLLVPVEFGNLKASAFTRKE